jgi:AcrR family transcriptional regulator
MPKRDDVYMAQRRDEILAATAKCLVRLGITATTTTEICREAGISMGALYKHFKSKEEIFVALAERAKENIDHYLTFHTAEEARSRLLARLARFYQPKNAHLFRLEVLLVAESLSSKAIETFGKGNYELSRQTLLRSFEGLVAAGETRAGFDAEIAATLIENFTFGLFFRSVAGAPENHSDAEAALNSLLDSLVGPLRAANSGKEGAGQKEKQMTLANPAPEGG